MTNLSPAAQAVLNASNLHPCKDSCLILAAALRATADQLSYLLPFEDSAHIDVADLLVIADELEDFNEVPKL